MYLDENAVKVSRKSYRPWQVQFMCAPIIRYYACHVVMKRHNYLNYRFSYEYKRYRNLMAAHTHTQVLGRIHWCVCVRAP